MNITDINIVTMNWQQTILSDEGFFRCAGFAPDQTRIILTDAFLVRGNPALELLETVNHEYLHIILEDIEDFNTSCGLDNISQWDIPDVSL